MAILTKDVRDENFAYRILAVADKTPDRRVNCPVLEFFHEQAQLHRDNLSKLEALLTDFARNGPRPSDPRFKRVAGTEGLFEFKAYQLRVFCFWGEGRQIICTNAVVKKQDRSNPDAIKTALAWKAAYLKAKAEGTIRHEYGR